MYIRINIINPRDIDFSENFPNACDAIVLRIEDNQVYRYSNGDWSPVYTSKSTITTFYRVCELMVQAMALHAENLSATATLITEESFDQIRQEMAILAASMR